MGVQEGGFARILGRERVKGFNILRQAANTEPA